MTNGNDSVTLCLMTEHDLAMLYEWLNRSHIVEWWAEKKHARHLLTYRNSFAIRRRVRHSYIAMLNGEPIGYASRTLLWKRGRMVGRRNRSRSTRNRPVTGECITGQRLGTSWFEHWLSCCSMIPRSPNPNGPVAEQLASDPMLRESGV